MRVRYSSWALRDLSNILDFISERSAPGAQNVKRAIQRTIQLIGEHSEAGRRLGATEIRVLRVRRYPYLVYWTIEADEVWIIHIRHGARRPWRDI
jgi:plasmid stabilization system protein ParE